MVSSEHQKSSEEGQEHTDGDGEEHETPWIQGATSTYSWALWLPTASHWADQLSPASHWLELCQSVRSDFLSNADQRSNTCHNMNLAVLLNYFDYFNFSFFTRNGSQAHGKNLQNPKKPTNFWCLILWTALSVLVSLAL